MPTGTVRILGGRVGGTIAAPASKSVTNRLLVMAALADGRSVLHHPLDSDDTRAMAELVTGLGAPVEIAGDRWTVEGTGGRLRPTTRTLDARLSGTTMRFGVALAALAEDTITLTGSPPLLRRPIGPLGDALRDLGATVNADGGFPPVSVAGPLRGGAVEVDVSGSSQYATALLLVAPYARDEDVELRLHGEAALAYVSLTASAMRRWGITVEERSGGRTWHVPHAQAYRAQATLVEYDASAAAHLETLAAATGGEVRIENADPATEQPDRAFGLVLDVMRGPGGTLRGAGTYDLGAMPDQLPNAAVLAALAEGVSEFTGVEVVRGHETDRIAALATELRKLGVDVTELRDGLRIVGGVHPATGSVRLATYDDHRLAMAFAALGAGVAGKVEVVVEDPECVTKTYPAFWEDARRLGLQWEQIP